MINNTLSNNCESSLAKKSTSKIQTLYTLERQYLYRDIDNTLTNCIDRSTIEEANIYTKKQYFKVVQILLELLAIKSLEYICFSYLCNVVDFIDFVNSKDEIIIIIINSCIIQTYNNRYTLELLKRKNLF